MDIETLINRVTLGDSLKIMQDMPPECVDMIATDPPYGIDFRASYAKGVAGRYGKIQGDKNLDWLGGFYASAYRILKNDAFAATFYGWQHGEAVLYAAKAAGFRPVGHIVWVKPCPGVGYFTRGQHENCFIFAKGKPPKPEKGESDVIYADRMPHDETNHPTPKPIDLMAKIIRRFAKTGDVVLAPFAGSCPPAFACRDLDMRYICMEISPDWHAHAVRRLKEAERQGRLV